MRADSLRRAARDRSLRWTAIATLLMLSACAVGPGGYGYADGPAVGVGVDYYEPFGAFDYGGWGPSYRSGPWRGGRGFDRDGHGFDHDGHGGPHPWRSPGFGRGIPSIPSGPHGGFHGGHGGGHR